MIPSHYIDDVLLAHFKPNCPDSFQKCIDEVCTIFSKVDALEVFCTQKTSNDITKRDPDFMENFEHGLGISGIYLEIK